MYGVIDRRVWLRVPSRASHPLPLGASGKDGVCHFEAQERGGRIVCIECVLLRLCCIAAQLPTCGVAMYPPGTGAPAGAPSPLETVYTLDERLGALGYADTFCGVVLKGAAPCTALQLLCGETRAGASVVGLTYYLSGSVCCLCRVRPLPLPTSHTTALLCVTVSACVHLWRGCPVCICPFGPSVCRRPGVPVQQLPALCGAVQVAAGHSGQ
jgi:hypothetical protein